MRRRLSLSFSFVEDVIYVGLGLLLTGVAAALLIAEIIYFVQDLLAGRSYSPHHIFVEVLYGVQVSFRQHVLRPGPFLKPENGRHHRTVCLVVAEDAPRNSRRKTAPEASDRRAYARARLFRIDDFIELALRRLLQ
jgi:hypothetical protein